MATKLLRHLTPQATHRGVPVSVISHLFLHSTEVNRGRGCATTSHGLGLTSFQAHPLIIQRSSRKMIATRAALDVATAVSAAAGTTAGGYTLLSFTPLTAVLGGLLLGIATAGKLLSTGRVLGISGAVKGLIAGDLARWRFAFLMGLGLGSVALAAVLPSAFEALPVTFPVWRAVLAGLLVGLGSSLGNGCTSGHGICGTARLSPRSFAYTATFMGAGMATATLASSAAALGVGPLPAAFAMPTPTEVQLAAALAGGGIAAFALLAAAQNHLRRSSPGASTPQQQQQQEPDTGSPEVASELLAGFLFAMGLGLSGMTRPSKVAGFLTLTAPSWDPSLPFVMAGAVAVALVAYQGVMRYKIMAKPLFCPRFQIPTSSVIDARLLAGGVLFGAGWGLAGMCPGPALVAALTGDVHVLSFVGAMAAGMWMEGHWGVLLERLAGKRNAKPMSS